MQPAPQNRNRHHHAQRSPSACLLLRLPRPQLTIACASDCADRPLARCTQLATLTPSPPVARAPRPIAAALPQPYLAAAHGPHSTRRKRSRRPSGVQAILRIDWRPRSRRLPQQPAARSGIVSLVRRHHHGHRRRVAVTARKRTPLAGVSARHTRIHLRRRHITSLPPRRAAVRRDHRRRRQHPPCLRRRRRLCIRHPGLRRTRPARSAAKRHGQAWGWRPRTRHQRGRHPRSADRRRKRRSRRHALLRRTHQHRDRARRRPASRPGILLRPAEQLGRAKSLHAMGAEHRLRGSARLRAHALHAARSRDRLGRSAWAAVFAATSSSGLPRSTATSRNDPGLSMVKYPSEFFNLPEPTSAP